MKPAVCPMICALILCFVTGFSSRAESPPESLRRGDALLIRIEGIGGGLPEYREIVDSNGQIELPFLGFHIAEGKSIPALEAEMAAAYSTANLSTTASVRVTYATHFEPPPARSTLVRVQDPRRPAPATNAFPAAPQ